MDRNTNQYTITPATGLIPADVAKKASELGLLPQLHEYSKMNAQRRRDVYQQVLSLAKALGASTDNVKASLQLDVIFDPDEVRQQQAAAAERAAAAAATAQRASAAAAAFAQRAAAHNVVITCRYYIDELDKVEEELERVKEENARLEKENATLVELLPGRGGSRKRKAMRGSTRRKRH
jgi:cell division septum initiation protein DivIVA